MRASPFLLLSMLSGVALSAAAQGADSTSNGPVLSLEDAVSLAIQNNPDHLRTQTELGVASSAKRAAYGQFLPSVAADGTALYQQQGAQPQNGVPLVAPSDVYQSSWFLGLTYRLGYNTFVNPKLQSANVRVAEADISGSAQLTRANVQQGYFTALESAAKAALDDSLVINAQGQLELAKARRAVGSGTVLDVSRAEVNLGQQQVNALQAHNQAEIDKLRLFQVMGVPQPRNVRLVSEFTVQEPAFSLDSVLKVARSANPTLLALQSRDEAAKLSVKATKSDYFPTLSLTTGWGGYTYELADGNSYVANRTAAGASQAASCFTNDTLRTAAGLSPIGGCNNYIVTSEQQQQLLAQNNQFPFNFNKQPFQFSATVHLPIFDGLDRERRVQEAEANQSSARYRVKAQQLSLTADVSAAYYTLVTSARTAQLQEQNAAKAREELVLAQERYRVGAATFLDLNDARASYERAENDRINAVYEFHKAFAALENAVGHPLR